MEERGITLGLEMWFDSEDGVRYVQYIEDRHGKGVYQVQRFPRED